MFDNIRFRGRLTGVPAVPLQFRDGSICRIEAEGGLWPKAIELRNVTIASGKFTNAHLSD